MNVDFLLYSKAKQSKASSLVLSQFHYVNAILKNIKYLNFKVARILVNWYYTFVTINGQIKSQLNYLACPMHKLSQ